jgi:hypothetical protein
MRQTILASIFVFLLCFGGSLAYANVNVSGCLIADDWREHSYHAAQVTDPSIFAETFSLPVKRVKVKIDYESSPNVWIPLATHFMTDDQGCFSGTIIPVNANASHRVKAIFDTDEFKLTKKNNIWKIVFPGFRSIVNNSLEFGTLHFDEDPELSVNLIGTNEIQSSGYVFNAFVSNDNVNVFASWFTMLEIKEKYISNIEAWPVALSHNPIQVKYLPFSDKKYRCIYDNGEVRDCYTDLEGLTGDGVEGLYPAAWYDDRSDTINLTAPWRTFRKQMTYNQDAFDTDIFPVYHAFAHWVLNQDQNFRVDYRTTFTPMLSYASSYPYHNEASSTIDDETNWPWEMASTYQNSNAAFVEGYANFMALLIDQGIQGCQYLSSKSYGFPSEFNLDFFSRDGLPLHFEGDHRPVSVTRAFCDLVDSGVEVKTWQHNAPTFIAPEHSQAVNLLTDGKTIDSNLVADNNFAYGFLKLENISDILGFNVSTPMLVKFPLTPGQEGKQITVFEGELGRLEPGRLTLSGSDICFLARTPFQDIYCFDKNTEFESPLIEIMDYSIDFGVLAFTKIDLPSDASEGISLRLVGQRLYLLALQADGSSRVSLLYKNQQGATWKELITIPRNDFVTFDVKEETQELFLATDYHVYRCDYLNALDRTQTAGNFPDIGLGRKNICEPELFAGTDQKAGYKRANRLESAFSKIQDIFIDRNKLYIVDRSGASAVDFTQNEVVQVAGQPTTAGVGRFKNEIYYNPSYHIEVSDGGEMGLVAMDQMFMNNLTPRTIPIGATNILSDNPNAETPMYPKPTDDDSVRYIHHGKRALLQSNISARKAPTDETTRSYVVMPDFDPEIIQVRIDETIPIETREFCGFEDVDLSTQLSDVVHIFANATNPNDANFESVLHDSGLLTDEQIEQILSANWIKLKSPETVASEFDVTCPSYEGVYLFDL